MQESTEEQLGREMDGLWAHISRLKKDVADHATISTGKRNGIRNTVSDLEERVDILEDVIGNLLLETQGQEETQEPLPRQLWWRFW